MCSTSGETQQWGTTILKVALLPFCIECMVMIWGLQNGALGGHTDSTKMPARAFAYVEAETLARKICGA